MNPIGSQLAYTVKDHKIKLLFIEFYTKNQINLHNICINKRYILHGL